MSKDGVSVSKSERKRQMRALHKLGERLIALPQSELENISISDHRLLEAILLAKRTSARSALKRQLKYIAKLIREADSELIWQGLERIDNRSKLLATKFKRLEVARDQMVKDGESALDNILKIWPAADSVQLRQLMHNLKLAKKNGRQKEYEKKIFRYLSELDEESIPEPRTASESRST